MSYEPYNDKYFIVRIDGGSNKHPYHKVFAAMGGRWNSRAKGGNGWLIPKNNEIQLKKFLESVQKQDELDSIQQHVKSRKAQHKYHRSVSDSEDETTPLIDYCKSYTQETSIQSNEDEEESEGSDVFPTPPKEQSKKGSKKGSKKEYKKGSREYKKESTREYKKEQNSPKERYNKLAEVSRQVRQLQNIIDSLQEDFK